MFNKSKVNKKKILSQNIEDQEDINKTLPLKEEGDNEPIENINTMLDKIKTIKSEINEKGKKPRSKGIVFKHMEDGKQKEPQKEEARESSIKKQFFSEAVLQQATDPEERKKLLGVKREEIEQIKEDRKQKVFEMQKELYTLPEHLKAVPQTKSDYVQNLMKLSSAGLIDVPLPLAQRLRSLEEAAKSTNKKEVMDNKLAEELDYLSVLKKLGPSYAKGYKSDLSHKTVAKLSHVFENVFTDPNSRKRKMNKEKADMKNNWEKH